MTSFLPLGSSTGSANGRSYGTTSTISLRPQKVRPRIAPRPYSADRVHPPTDFEDPDIATSTASVNAVSRRHESQLFRRQRPVNRPLGFCHSLGFNGSLAPCGNACVERDRPLPAAGPRPGRARHASRRRSPGGAGAECTVVQTAVALREGAKTVTTSTAATPRRWPPPPVARRGYAYAPRTEKALPITTEMLNTRASDIWPA